jgi:serine/threonine-protein kinase
MHTPNEGESSQEVVANRFRIDGRIARGGMAEVYRAPELATGNVLALKWLRPDMSDDQRVTAMFRLEFHTLRRIAHPTIIDVHEYGLLTSPASRRGRSS